ncbi:MAG: ABC transporter ATP-binding protein [Bdellovibrionales bacterium]|nr:ABC transporter ATP-binding protein [Bdellovibrionales bacterium]
MSNFGFWGLGWEAVIFGWFRSYPFFHLLGRYKGRLGIGLVALVLVDLTNVALPLAVKSAIDAVTAGSHKDLQFAAWAILGLMAAQAVTRYLWRWYLVGTSHFIARDLRRRMYAHLQNLSLDYYQRVRTGDLMSRATNDIESIRMAVGPGLLVALDAIILFALMIPAMIYLSPKLTLLTFCLFPIVPWFTTKIGDRIDTLFEAAQKKMSRLSGYTQETLSAIRLVKSLVFENKSKELFSEFSEAYRSEGIKLARYQSFFSPTLSLITSLGTFTILLAGGMDVISGAITVGTFVAFQRYVVQITWPMEAIGWAVTMNREGFAAYRRLEEVLQTPTITLAWPSPQPHAGERDRLWIPKLRYTYPDTQKAFELNLSELRIPPGGRIGLVGPVGSGKSTLFNLILRLNEPEAGSIYFNGTDVVSLPLHALRQDVASVEQQIFLFSESLRDNVSMGLDETLTESTVQTLLKSTALLEEVTGLDKGVETLLGERGVNLSGGQKQRLALARALARRPQLLLLDDCFSAVDVEVEERIIQSLLSAFPDLTLCVCSHRMSIMPQLDEVWLLENGRLTAKGTHNELLRTSRTYYRLWHQKDAQEWGLIEAVQGV